MRILVLNQYFHPDRSATSQLLTELCDDLAEHHDVFVVTGRPSYSAVEATGSRGIVSKERHGRVRIARVWSTAFDRNSMPRRLTNYATYLASSLAGAFSVRRPDVVVALTDPPPIGLIGAFVARIRGIPFVLVTKDIFPDVAERLGMIRNGVAIGIMRAVKRTLFASADRIVSIGRDMDRRLLEVGVPPEKIVTIHDWADCELIRPLEEPSVLRKERGWEDRFVVMHSGNVGLSQDLETVVEAAALMRNESDVLFAIVGEGASKGRLQQLTVDRGLTNVAFLPYQDKSNLSESLGAADVHLVTLREGLAGFIVPSKVYGILAAGRPLIAAVEGNSEPALIVEEFDCGLRVPPGDPGALVEGVRRLQTMDRLGMGERGRGAAVARFDRQVSTAAYRELLERLTRPNLA